MVKPRAGYSPWIPNVVHKEHARIGPEDSFYERHFDTQYLGCSDGSVQTCVHKVGFLHTPGNSCHKVPHTKGIPIKWLLDIRVSDRADILNIPSGCFDVIRAVVSMSKRKRGRGVRIFVLVSAPTILSYSTALLAHMFPTRPGFLGIGIARSQFPGCTVLHNKSAA